MIVAATAPVLAHDVVSGALAAGDVVAVFAHGILGSRSNWKSFVRRFVERVPTATAIMVDLRHHGESHGFAEPDTVSAAADDIEALCAQLKLPPTVLVGHSWGGKAVLDLGLRAGSTVKDVVVVDSPPGLRSFGQTAVRGEIERVIEALESLPPGIARDRKHLIEQLVERGLSTGIAAWMTTNLQPLSEPTAAGLGFTFKFSLPAVRRMLRDYGRTDFWPQIAAHHGPPKLHMVRGAKSDRWTADEQQRLHDAVAAGTLTDHVLQTGHWVHTEDPEGLLQIVVDVVG